MRIIVTGGGTGGHVFPALEVARLAAEQGADIRYYGSLRGMEGATCAARGIPFFGYPAGPVTRMRSPSGVRAMAVLGMSIGRAARRIRIDKPDAVFSTGGYSAAPTLWAARWLKVPYAIHEANSVPGRVNRMFAKGSAAFTYTFRTTSNHLNGIVGDRTGQPIRQELRAASEGATATEPLVLILGGSQGSRFLNQLLPGVAKVVGDRARFILAAGKGQYEETARQEIPPKLEVVPFLEQDRLVDAYRQAQLVIARSGGTLAELAMFGLPSVLVPLPTSADDHQLENAREFAAMNAATVTWQPDYPARDGLLLATAENVSEAVVEWLADGRGRQQASQNLRDWDAPDATEQIVARLFQAASGHS